MNAHMIIGIIVAIVSCLLACGGALWRLASTIADTKHDVDLNKEKIDALKDLATLSANGLKERIDHAKTRLQTETEILDRRVDAIELYLSKNTSFEKRS